MSNVVVLKIEKMKLDQNYFKLSILDLRLLVHLGCSDEERLNPQLVSFNIDLYFHTLPKGTYTDSLQDTVCYRHIADSITEYCQGKHFNLIENLTESIYQLIYKLLLPHHDSINLITINTHKLSPPIKNVNGGVSFTYHVNIQ